MFGTSISYFLIQSRYFFCFYIRSLPRRCIVNKIIFLKRIGNKYFRKKKMSRHVTRVTLEWLLGISVHVREFAYVPACEHICHRMRVYIGICASTCMCVCLRGCARVNVCVCASVCVCMCVHMHARVCSLVRLWTCVPIKRVDAGVRIYTCVCTCACVRVHVHNMC